MDRLGPEFSSSPQLHEAGLMQRCWYPPADVYEAHRGWLIKLALSGVHAEDVELTLEGARLIVRGVRRDGVIRPGVRQVSLEIPYGPFERVIELPLHPGDARIVRDQRSGMLLIGLQPSRASGVRA
jgi:HSP20 family molecular chaperone IbpA